MKLSGVAITGAIPHQIIERVSLLLSKERITTINTLTAHQAAFYAQTIFKGQPYELGVRDCAMFAAQFASYYGIPLVRTNTTNINEYSPQPPKDPMPDASTIFQVKWFETAATLLPKELIQTYSYNQIADINSWHKINPGSLLYLRNKGRTHHGYNTYFHTLAYIGINKQQPIFAEYNVGMKKGPEVGIPLDKILSRYQNLPNDQITGTIINVPGLSTEIWQRQTGKVSPNYDSRILREAGQQILTINLIDGTATYWQVDSKGKFIQKPFENKEMEVRTERIGTQIPSDPYTILTFYKFTQPHYFVSLGMPTTEEGCFYGAPLCVPRFLTIPPMVAGVNLTSEGASLEILYSPSTGKIEKGTPQHVYILQPSNAFLPKNTAITFPPQTFEAIRKTIDKGIKTILILSYPQFPQDILLQKGNSLLGKDPLLDFLNTHKMPPQVLTGR